MKNRSDAIPPSRGDGPGNPIYKIYLIKYALLGSRLHHKVIQLAMHKIASIRGVLNEEKKEFMRALEQELDELLDDCRRMQKPDLQASVRQSSQDSKPQVPCFKQRLFKKSPTRNTQDMLKAPQVKSPKIWQSDEMLGHSLFAELWVDLANPTLQDIVLNVRRALKRARLPEEFLMRLCVLEWRSLRGELGTEDTNELASLRYIASVLQKEPSLLKGVEGESEIKAALMRNVSQKISQENIARAVIEYFVEPTIQSLNY